MDGVQCLDGVFSSSDSVGYLLKLFSQIRHDSAISRIQDGEVFCLQKEVDEKAQGASQRKMQLLRFPVQANEGWT